MNFRNFMSRGLLAALALFVGTQAFAARTTTYFHNDGLGSAVAATNQAGQVLWRKNYAPFGAQLDTPPVAERTSYTGKQHDDVTGLTYFGGRNFDPELGRFVSIDPVAFTEANAMSFNRYLYVNNNPYKYVDPDGEFLNFAAKFILDVAINVALNYVTTGEMNVGGALKDSALGLLNPAKTAANTGKLVMALAKVSKVAPSPGAATGFAAKSVTVSRKRFPESAAHIDDAAKAGKPTRLTIDRPGAPSNRRDAMRGTKTTPGRDRDEFPPAMFKEGGKGASVRKINPADNRGAGACIAGQCRGLPNGTKVDIKVVD